MALWETGEGARGASGFSQPKYNWEQQWRPQEDGRAGGCMAASQTQRRQLLLPLGEPGDGARCFPCRGKGSPARGGTGERRASVTVRTHGRGPFSFPLGRLRFRVFLL
uniref:Uncharacterized protein n=1 Tax=Cebus imitator TaxID=2715852 RepID=A0A2K5PG00_CEBIM